MTHCETCHGTGRIEYGEFGFDCAAMHNGGRMPDAPGLAPCDDCGGTGQIDDEDEECNDMSQEMQQPGDIDDHIAMLVSAVESAAHDMAGATARSTAKEAEALLKLEIDRAQTEAYAEGRKDEREEWLPVLEALIEERRVRLLGQEPDVHWESMRDIRRACYAATDAAIAKAEGRTE